MDVLTLLARARERNVWLTCAESCTGGLVAAALTEIAGCSDVFAGGTVVYANVMKQQLIAVDAALLERYGAVSAEVAVAMARGAAQLAARTMQDGRDILSVAITGVAGPSGGSVEKPVGCVHIATCVLRGNEDIIAQEKYLFSGDRASIRQQSVIRAVHMMAQALA